MIREKQPITEVELSLDGPAILKEMMSGDYENLIEVFDGYFGHFCILER